MRPQKTRMLSLCLLNFTFSCQQESGRIGQASRPRCPPDEGRQGPKCGHQRPTGRAPRRRNIRYLMQAPEAHRTGKIWSRIQTPEAHEKREDLVPNPDIRGPPEEGKSGPVCRLYNITNFTLGSWFDGDVVWRIFGKFPKSIRAPYTTRILD